jgi:hypothetical protein
LSTAHHRLCSAAMILTPVRQLAVTDALASGHAFLTAASGLVRLGETLCVVGDDEHHIALFNSGDDGPGRLLRLIEGDLPLKRKARKKAKPDFEILFALPSGEGETAKRLCALGSGSKPQRMRGVIIDLSDDSVTLIVLKPMFDALAPLVPEINLEGAVVRGERLLLFNRGNMAHPESFILEIPLAALWGDEAVKVRLVKRLTLPMIDGVPLTVTDACGMDDGRFLLSAVAEVTDDSIADGEVRGAAIIILDADLDVVRVEPLEPVIKIEGISPRRTAQGVELLCVSDADDPDVPSVLYAAMLDDKASVKA